MKRARKAGGEKPRTARRPMAPKRRRSARGKAVMNTKEAARVQELAGLMRSLQIFEGIPRASLTRIARELKPRHLPAGAVVCKQGDPADEFCLLTAGRLEVTVAGGDPESPPVGTIEAPGWFGELAILTRQPRTATLRALTESELWTLSRERFEAAFARHPEMARNLIATLSGRIQRKDQDFLGQSSLAIERARLARKVQEQAKQLEVVSKHKSQFLASMSHELRTPLNAIIGFSEVLLDPNLGPLPEEEQREFLTNILTSGKHLLRLINDVLDISKIEAGKMELHPEASSLAETVEGVLGTIKPLASKKRIATPSDCPADLPPVWADPPRLKQILYNLLSNAIKFTPEGGRVTVAARRVNLSSGRMVDSSRPINDSTTRPIDSGGEFLEVAVTDTGIGIPAEDLDRVFGEFEQVHDASRSQEGTGLGLSLVKRLVELHGGRIRVSSTVGKASTFTFTIPVATS